MQPTAPRHRSEPPGLVPGTSRRKKPAPRRDGQEIALRLLKDGTTETIPLTLDVLLSPSEEVHVPQNDAHSDDIFVIMQRLKRHVERRPGWRLFTDLIVKWPGERDVSPDITIVEGLSDTSHKRRSLDVAKEGCWVRAVIEVVTTTSAVQREKDEESNPPLFERQGVTDSLLIYPREHRKVDDVPLVLRSLGRGGKYGVRRKPNAQGRFLMRSLGVYVSVRTKGGREEVVFEDVRTGELLTTVEEEEIRRLQEEKKRLQEEKKRLQEEKKRLQEEKKRLQEEKKRKAEAAKRRQAERRAAAESKARQQAESQADAARQTLAQTLLNLLESRGLALNDRDRRRILRGGLQELQSWLERLPNVTTVNELWASPSR